MNSHGESTMILNSEPFQMNSKGLIILLLLFLAFASYSQEKDFQMWTELGIKKEINKDFSLSLNQEFRFNENASTFDKWHSTFGLEYDITKYVRMRVMYRYSQNKDLEKGFEVAHRYLSDVILRKKVKRFNLSYRLRYQMDYEKDFTGEALYMDSQALRSRFMFKYNIRKNPLTPYTSYEFLYRLNNPYGNSIERNRITIGIDYNLTDNLSANLYYRYQTSSGNDVRAKNYYITGIGMSYKF